MRSLATVLLALSLLFPNIALANHYPPELEFLNGLESYAGIPCPIAAAEELRCEVLVDALNGKAYLVAHTQEHRVLAVRRYAGDGWWIIVYRDRTLAGTAPEEQ